MSTIQVAPSPANLTASRRLFLKAGIGVLTLSSALSLAVHAAQTTADPVFIEDLSAVLFDFFPHKTLAKNVYHEAALSAYKQAPAAITAAVKKLETIAKTTRWSKAKKAARTQAIAALVGTPEFYLLRSSAIGGIYRSPTTYAFVGYGGSSIEHGGYLYRGFNDIDWLPEGQ